MAADTDCQPVYVTARALPAFDAVPDTIDLCMAAERVTGKGTVRGAQRIRGLWRLYPKQKQFRDQLLIEGIELSGVRVALLDKNPFGIYDENGQEKPATKVWVSDIPISCKNSAIEDALKKLGCEIRSPVKNELARDRSGQLTSWETGRRFLIITTPKEPLPLNAKVGIHKAALYHKEQRAVKTKCNKCLIVGHVAAECTGSVVCFVCRQEGHKKGDPVCNMPPSPPSAATQQEEMPATESGAVSVSGTDREGAECAGTDTPPGSEGTTAPVDRVDTPPRARHHSKRRRSASEEKKKNTNRRSRLEDYFGQASAAPSDTGEKGKETPACTTTTGDT